jgi:steroid delta-isomerase-like uncharacterized protein
MTMNRVVADCRQFPSEKNCSLTIAGTEDEVLGIALEHAVTAHGHERTPALREDLRKILSPEPAAGAAEANRELARKAMEDFNKRDMDAIERRAHSDITVINVASGEVFHGPKGLRAHLERWTSAFPDARAEVDRITAADDGYVVEFIGSGTNTGPLLTPSGSVPPTGKRISLRFAESTHVSDGKLTESRLYFDLASMMSQLGLGPQAPGAVAGSSQQAEQRAAATDEQRRH